MFSRQERLLLFVLAAIQFNHIVDFMIVMPLGPQLMRLFNMTPQEFGFLVSAYTFSAAISGFVASFFMDRFDRKKLLLFFFFGFSVGTLACALSPTAFFLFFARSITGIFGGVLNSLVMSIVSDSFPYSKRGAAMGVISTAFSLSSILGVPFSLYLANQWNWHSPFVFLGVLSLILWVLFFKAVPSQAKHLALQKPDEKPWVHFSRIFQSPPQLIAIAFAGLLVLSQFVLIPFLSPSLVANAGLSEDQLPFVYLVGGLLSIITGPLVGRWSDRAGKKRVFLFVLLASLLPILLVTHLAVTPIAVVLAISGGFFVAVGSRMVPAMAMISASSPQETRGSFMSVVSSMQQLMAAVGAAIAGAIVYRDSAGHLVNYNWIGYLSLALSLGALYLSQKLKVLENTSPPSAPAPAEI